MDDAFGLHRFLAVQEAVMPQVLAELRAGRKRTHWMWFVFPQLRGLGTSAMAHRYGLASLEEARAFLAHPVLGPRLRACAALVLAAPGTAHDILGTPDELKFRSCMTIFAAADAAETLFPALLVRFFGGQPDPRTLALL